MGWMWLTWTAAGYLAGSIPVGLLIGRLRGVDVRQAGSGNIGATNVGRVLGRKWGVLCFLLDVAKGLTPVLGAGVGMDVAGRSDLAGAAAWAWLAVGMAAVLGHVFPVWLRFRGGKGVATGLGVLLGFWPVLTVPALVAGLIWLGLAAAFRYVSLASMAAALSLPVSLVVAHVWRGSPTAALWPFLTVAVLLALLVVWRHRGNLARLRAGTENRIGGGHRPPAATG